MQRLAIDPEQLNADGAIALTPAQGRYLYRVLRLKGGDRFVALLTVPRADQGQWIAELEGADRAIAHLISPAPITRSPLPPIVLLAAPPKGNAFDEVVRQAVELGAGWIVPVLSDRGLVQPSDNKLDRWRRIALEATEQCERPDLPAIAPPVPSDRVGDCLENLALGDRPWCRWLCVARGGPDHLLTVALAAAKAAHQDETDAESPVENLPAIAIAIGPEGGWSDREKTRFQNNFGFAPVHLGDRILRAATAPLVALSLVAAAWESTPAQTSDP
ncbi:MAG: 16S rRNA (uracil(1498)-N(3))-methyltransferase [Cyanophyceae cyanobacterium]